MTKPKTKIVVFHCPEPLHTALMDLARREGEPASTLLRRVTREMVQADPFAARQAVLSTAP